MDTDVIGIKGFRRYHCHIKCDGIKHGIRILLIQSRVVHHGDKAGDLHVLTLHPDGIAHLATIVVCMHTVDGDLSIILRRLTLQIAGMIDLIRGLIDADLSVLLPVTVLVLFHILVEVLIQLHGNCEEVFFYLLLFLRLLVLLLLLFFCELLIDLFVSFFPALLYRILEFLRIHDLLLHLCKACIRNRYAGGLKQSLRLLLSLLF